MTTVRPRFGVARLLGHTSIAERALFRMMGVADPAHWLHLQYLEQALDRWSDLFPRQILDAGSGAGDHTIYLAQRFPQAKVVGVDLDARSVARSRSLAAGLGLTNVTFELGDLVTMRFAEPFDLIVSIDVLEHIVGQENAVRNLRNHLAPGGRFFFHIPTVRERPVLLSRWLSGFHAWAEQEHVAKDRRPAEFAEVVREAGLTVERVTRTFGRYSGELAVSLFCLPHRNTLRNRILQGLLAPFCRLAAWADLYQVDQPRYAVAVMGRRMTREAMTAGLEGRSLDPTAAGASTPPRTDSG